MFLTQTISSGLGFYNMSIYMVEFSKSLQVSLAQASFAVTLFFMVGGVTGMYVARLLERVHVRWIMVAGSLIGGAALSATVLVDSLWQLYALYTLFGVGYTCVSLVVATTLITQWFPGPTRSVALSIASTGLSFGGVIITPATAYLFNIYGAPVTIPWLGVAFAGLILPLALWVVRPAPQQIMGAQRHNTGRWTYRSAIRTRFFILLSVGYVFCQASQVGGIAHLYNRVEGMAGFEKAAIAVQILTVCSILGRFAGGWLAMHVRIRQFALLNLVVQMAGLGILSVAEDTGTVFLGAGLFGVSIGNLLMLQPLWLAEAFSGSLYPRVFALSNAATLLGVALGPFVLGVAFDIAGYTVAYGVAVAVCAMALVFMYLAGARPQTAYDTLTT
jgi:MFS family permease